MFVCYGAASVSCVAVGLLVFVAVGVIVAVLVGVGVLVGVFVRVGVLVKVLNGTGVFVSTIVEEALRETVSTISGPLPGVQVAGSLRHR